MAKGSQFERDISRKLSLWWTDGERDDVYWRTSQSGGRATMRSRKGKKTANSYGDIMALDTIGEPLTVVFCIELKRGYNKTSLLEMVDSNNKKINLIEFWKQVERDRIKGEKMHSLLIFKRDRKKECVMIDWASFCLLENYCCRFGGSLLTYSDVDYYWAIISLEDFLGWVDPETIKAISEQRG